MSKPTMDMTVKGRMSSSQGKLGLETTLALEKKQPNSVFRSTVDRFGISYSAKNPGIRILKNMGIRRGKTSEGRKHIYNQTMQNEMLGADGQITCIQGL